ncbi:caspase family protein [Streptomyces sp. NPDC002896]|uniref:caspase family protein n=1 Tax=Streptomyces sp. NPDC002896 TaxID=3154438 RepID=UPI00331EA5C3
MAAGGRRFLIALGVGEYQDPEIENLPGVRRDVEEMRELLTGHMGYEPALSEVSENPLGDLDRRVEAWEKSVRLDQRDVVVLYFAGHGVSRADRHYLLCADSRADRPRTALASEDLCRPLLDSGLGHLLVILDTCYAGAGATNMATLAHEFDSKSRALASRWLVAAARGKELAAENAFVPALLPILKKGLPEAARQRYLDMGSVVEQVNEAFKAGRIRQTALYSVPSSYGTAKFFHNLSYQPRLPHRDLTLERITQLAKAGHNHFAASGRSVKHVTDPGDYFVGRADALKELESWPVPENPDRRMRVVTGAPGVGKSALLGRFLMRAKVVSDGREGHDGRDGHEGLEGHEGREGRRESGGDASPVAALEGMEVVGLHARHAVLDDLVSSLAVMLDDGRSGGSGGSGRSGRSLGGIKERVRRRDRPIVVVVDALDEAGPDGDVNEARRIAREFLKPLADESNVRLVVGTRKHLLQVLGEAVVTMDLDAPAYADNADVAGYVRALLLDEDNPGSPSPYRGHEELAAKVAHGVAAQAGNSFLVARMTAHALVHRPTVLDIGEPGWEQRLPTDARQAFAQYLERFGHDRAKVERLLRPLAYAQGSGLPWSAMWVELAHALSGVPCSQDDLRWLREKAGAYIVEVAPHADQHESTFRLCHEMLADYLRDDSRAHEKIAEVLTGLVPRNPVLGPGGWQAAHWYVRDHLATHAAAAERLDGLLADGDFLVHATPRYLRPALRAVKSQAARLRRSIYQASEGVHATAGPEARRDILAIDAARFEEHDLAAELARERPWRPRWATGHLVHPAHAATMRDGDGNGWVEAVACTVIDGRPHVVSAATYHSLGDDPPEPVARVWDLTTSSMVHALGEGHSSTSAVACVEIEGRPHAVFGFLDGSAQVWDLTTGMERRSVRQVGREEWVMSVACTEIDGRPHAVCGHDGTVRVWDLLDGSEYATLTGHTDRVEAMECTEIEGAPYAVSGSRDETVRVWDLTNRREHAVFSCVAGVDALACVQIDGHPHVVTDCLQVWDLHECQERKNLNFPRELGCRDLTFTTINDGLHVVYSVGEVIRVWNLSAGMEHAAFTGHEEWVEAVACAYIEGRPHAVSGSHDGTVRVWDLTDRKASTSESATRIRVRTTCGEIDGIPYVAIADSNRISIQDVSTGSEYVGRDHDGLIWDLAWTEINGRPHVVYGNQHAAYVWDLAPDSKPIRLTQQKDGVHAVACKVVNGQSYAAFGGGREDPRIRVWDLNNRREKAVLVGFDGLDDSLAWTEVNGKHKIIAVGYSKVDWNTLEHALRIWDPLTGRRILSRRRKSDMVLRGNEHEISTVSCTEIDNRPHAVSGGIQDHTVRVWDLTTGEEKACLKGHQGPVEAVACITIGDRPHVVSAGKDRTVRVWDLARDRLVETIALPLPAETLVVSGRDIIVGMNAEVLVLTRATEILRDGQAH